MPPLLEAKLAALDLPEREKDIFRRRCRGQTYARIAKFHGVSEDWTRQVHVGVQEAMRALIASQPQPAPSPEGRALGRVNTVTPRPITYDTTPTRKTETVPAPAPPVMLWRDLLVHARRLAASLPDDMHRADLAVALSEAVTSC
jgi:hypothetical protein